MCEFIDCEKFDAECKSWKEDIFKKPDCYKQPPAVGRSGSSGLLDCRTAFEVWATNEPYAPLMSRGDSGYYDSTITEWAWQAWKACWELRAT